MLKKGIAMVTLVAVISIMLLLVSIITISGIQTSNTSRKITFASELDMLQDAVDSYRTINNGEFPISDFIVLDLKTASEDVKNQFVKNDEEILNDTVLLSKIDYTKLDIGNIKRGHSDTQDDIYAVSNKTGIVYYAKGQKIGNDTYYTLTEELKKLLEYNKKSDEVLSDNAIIFVTNTNKWTNDNVSIEVKVPKEYTDVSIANEKNTINVDKEDFDENYYVYKFNVEENCTINVSYTDKNGSNKVSSFSVMNIDKNNPDIEVSRINNSNTNKKFVQLKGIDLESGIKKIKYDSDKINNDNIGKIYFNSNGIDVNNNSIEVDKNIPYITLYVEDNAGNFNIKTIELN